MHPTTPTILFNFFSLHPFVSLLFHSLSLVFSLFCAICASQSFPSFSPVIVYMYIYKSAHNRCLGKSKEQWGREAIRGIKRGAASQPSFTGQWSKSNWVLFCSGTHVYTHPYTRTCARALSLSLSDAHTQTFSDSGGGTQLTAGPLGHSRAGHV